MAQEWIDMLFFGVTNVWSAQVMSLPLARGMEAMFQT